MANDRTQGIIGFVSFNGTVNVSWEEITYSFGELGAIICGIDSINYFIGLLLDVLSRVFFIGLNFD